MTYEIIEMTPLQHAPRSTWCEMSEKLRQRLHLPKNLTSLKIGCGMHTVTCPIVFIKEDHFGLSLSEDVLNKLCLPIHSFSLQGTLKNNQQLQLGPVIGLLTEIKTTEDGVRFGSIHEFCKELAAYCMNKGVFFYIFSLTTYNNQQIEGYYLHESEWKKSIVPYPNVVHNRISSRKRERSKEFLQVISDIIENNVPYFNERFLNKWEVHQILSESEHLKPYLPMSQLYESKSSLEYMLTVNKDIFIKPINGSQGRRIFRVKEKDDQTYFLDFTTFSGEINTEFTNLQKLYSALSPRLKKGRFLLQETIQLNKYQNRTLDFRFLCHKKDFHQWKVTSAVARVSEDNQFVANLARGGQIYPIKSVLSELYGKDESRHLRKMLAELSLEIVNTVSLHAGGEFGEFGIDLGLDPKGHPWIIEVNTKPSKLENDQKSERVRPSARSIINYCLFLSQLNGQ
ncbi:YheC/YheD family protein [uncultured Metabacillus sp.]|uniref:YheC/YheD family endospore coat-associated protein n=1 Tax=uncultured Metabacillus sp. TaxID=2860135 RepID=UPI0026393234|nr:YheC/YheD family protein [uncultured Metabacillus sp.]